MTIDACKEFTCAYFTPCLFCHVLESRCFSQGWEFHAPSQAFREAFTRRWGNPACLSSLDEAVSSTSSSRHLLSTAPTVTLYHSPPPSSDMPWRREYSLRWERQILIISLMNCRMILDRLDHCLLLLWKHVCTKFDNMKAPRYLLGMQWKAGGRPKARRPPKPSESSLVLQGPWTVWFYMTSGWGSEQW